MIDIEISVTFEKIVQTKLKRFVDLSVSTTSSAQITTITSISFNIQQFAINAMYYTYDTKIENENNNQHVFTTKYDEMYNSNNFVSKMRKSASKLVQMKKFDSKNEKFEMNEIVIQRFFAMNSITIFANSKYDSKSNVDQSAKIYTIKTRKKKKRMKHDDETFDVKEKFAAKSFEFIEKTSATTFVKKKKRKSKRALTNSKN